VTRSSTTQLPWPPLEWSDPDEGVDAAARTGPPTRCCVSRISPIPAPGPGELLIDVEVAGVSYPDLLLVWGEYQVALLLPSTPGAELVGWAVLGGPGTSVAPGARIVRIAGGYGERAVITEAHVCPSGNRAHRIS
jgi:NADPH:quinone reductase-like Zn-dependent oxidoreductase